MKLEKIEATEENKKPMGVFGFIGWLLLYYAILGIPLTYIFGAIGQLAAFCIAFFLVDKKNKARKAKK